jgi:hypothetical protein
MEYATDSAYDHGNQRRCPLQKYPVRAATARRVLPRERHRPPPLLPGSGSFKRKLISLDQSAKATVLDSILAFSKTVIRFHLQLLCLASSSVIIL